MNQSTFSVLLTLLCFRLVLPVSALDAMEQNTGAGIPEGEPDSRSAPPLGNEDIGAEAEKAQVSLSQPEYLLNYQGYVTDSASNPIEGAFSLTVALYDAPIGGNLVWGPELHSLVQIQDGLFNLTIGRSIPLVPSVFEKALYLEITVAGETMPRQPLRPSAYALSLVPGGSVLGTPEGTPYALSVTNTSKDPNARGMYASGRQYGLVAEETGDGDVAIYTPDFVLARGYRSTEDSFLFVPGISGTTLNDGSLELNPQGSGTVRLRAKSITNGHVLLVPINTPTVLFGHSVTIEEVTLYYECDSPENFITLIELRMGTGVEASELLFSDDTDLKSLEPTSVSFTSGATLSDAAGPLTLSLWLSFANTADQISIGGVRVRLGHQPLLR